MPVFLRPLHESNDCHNPKGPGGGQFCSTEGGGNFSYETGPQSALRALMAPHEKVHTASVIVDKDPASQRAAVVTAAVLAEMKEAGYLMPNHIEVRRQGFHDKSTEGVQGNLERRGGVLTLRVILPPGLPDDANLDDAVALAFGNPSTVNPRWAYNDPDYSRYDEFASRTMADVIVHEMGHLQAGKRGNVPFMKLLQEGTFPTTDAVRRAMMRVSEYTTRSMDSTADEFLAEAFTRIYRGETLPEDSQTLYDALQGPKVTWRGPRRAGAVQ